MKEQIRLMLAQRYSRRSEKLPPNMPSLFDESELETSKPPTEEPSPAQETTTVGGHERKKPGRRPLPGDLPREERVYELPESERICPTDGTVLVEIGRETSEQLDVIPAQVRVILHTRIKYGCPCCRQGVKTAPKPVQPIPRSIASPGLLAHVAVCKYVDALPLYRQEEILQRIGVTLPRATMANWMIQCGTLIQPLINLLRDHLLDYDILNMDETTVQVLSEKDRKPSAKSYMWVQKGGVPETPVLLFNYDPSRGGKVAVSLLEGFQGYLQTDGYIGYLAVGTTANVIHVGCWAHARRKFDEAIKAAGKGRTGMSGHAMAEIQKLYAIEKRIRGKEPDIRYQVRQQESRPVLEKLKSWADAAYSKVTPSGHTGKALHYLREQWNRLMRYLDDGRLEMDNNQVENAIRPFVMGRKNWLFSDSVNGAKSSANLYSLIETAKANGIEPYHYLRTVFTNIPAAQSLEDFEKLLPWNIQEKASTVN